MGVAATIGATLLGGFISGRAQQQQYNAAAQQAEVNAQIANQNADKLQAQAEEQSKSNTINEENKRRRMNAMLSQQRGVHRIIVHLFFEKTILVPVYLLLI